MVQSTSALNPYTNPEAALARRNLVLDTLIENLPDKADELRAAKAQPLGILPQPNALPQGCIAAGDRAFFCDYALQYPGPRGLDEEDVARNGYLIRTTLDPKVQDSVKNAIDNVAEPDPRRRRERDERDQTRQGRPPHPRDGATTAPTGSTSAPARPCSRSRSRWSATAPARYSRSSPRRRRSRWGWASTRNSMSRRRSRAPGLGSSNTPGARRRPGV